MCLIFPLMILINMPQIVGYKIETLEKLFTLSILKLTSPYLKCDS